MGRFAIASDLGRDEDRILARRVARIRLGEQLGDRAQGAPAVDLAVLPGGTGADGQEQEEEQ